MSSATLVNNVYQVILKNTTTVASAVPTITFPNLSGPSVEFQISNYWTSKYFDNANLISSNDSRILSDDDVNYVSEQIISFYKK